MERVSSSDDRRQRAHVPAAPVGDHEPFGIIRPTVGLTRSAGSGIIEPTAGDLAQSKLLLLVRWAARIPLPQCGDGRPACERPQQHGRLKPITFDGFTPSMNQPPRPSGESTRDPQRLPLAR